MSSAVTNEHYVPQFLLRNFACGSGGQIFVFDKATERSFSRPIRRVASEPGFYDCEVGGAPYTIDPLLTDLENVASRFIARVVARRSLRVLSATGRRTVALFATVQMLRTDSRRKELKRMIDGVRAAVKSIGADPSRVGGFEFLNDEQTRAASITSLRTLAADLTPYLLNQSWILYSTGQEHPFYISDNPVTRFNRRQRGALGMLGLRALGIEVYLPLSSTLCLGFLCPTIKPPFRIRLFGGADKLSPANVKHFNSLQVFNAERFVYSQRDDFTLVRQMLRQVPELKRGPAT